MATTGGVSIKILGEKLEFDTISTNLQLIPTGSYKKGVVYSKYVGATENDVWYYEIEILDGEKPENALGKLLNVLKSSGGYIRELGQTQHISIRCSIQSDMAQVFFSIPPSLIKEISELNIGFEVSIFSWGEAENS